MLLFENRYVFSEKFSMVHFKSLLLKDVKKKEIHNHKLFHLIVFLAKHNQQNKE